MRPTAPARRVGGDDSAPRSSVGGDAAGRSVTTQSRGKGGSQGPMPTPHSGSTRPTLPVISPDAHVVALELNDPDTALAAAMVESADEQQKVESERQQEDAAFSMLLEDVAAMTGDDTDALTSELAHALQPGDASPASSQHAAKSATRTPTPESAAESGTADGTAAVQTTPGDNSAPPPAGNRRRLTHAQPPAAPTQPASRGTSSRAAPSRTAAAQRKQSKVVKPTTWAAAAAESRASAAASQAGPNG